MDTNSDRRSPLYWPQGWSRIPPHKRKSALFSDHGIDAGRRAIEAEVKRFGGKDLIISTNLELRLDGLPRSGQRQPEDPGVAIYFHRNRQDVAIACDQYRTVHDNLWALSLTLDALRRIERYGSPTLINAALPTSKPSSAL